MFSSLLFQGVYYDIRCNVAHMECLAYWYFKAGMSSSRDVNSEDLDETETFALTTDARRDQDETLVRPRRDRD